MEGVFAKKVDSGQIKGSVACSAFASLEDGWFRGELFKLTLFGFCFCRVTRDETTILYEH